MRVNSIASVFIILILISCSSSENTNNEWQEETSGFSESENEGLEAPPKTWQEHWFDHEQLVTRVYHDDHLALYYDKEVDPTIEWPANYLSDVWMYIKSVYGKFGEDPRLYAIFHTNKYSGGHPSVYMDESHDFRNVVDCGPHDWQEMKPQAGLNMIIHEIGHIVEGATNGIKQNPAWNIWKDSKWAEIFIYDVYKNTGQEEFAKEFHDEMMGQHDNFPRANTQWFKDWFYPIYSQHGEAEVLNNFYDLLEGHFPKNNEGNAFSRRMNMGEFVHFWSGAAGVDLQPMAKEAFGWPEEWKDQLAKAKSTFRGVNY